MRKNLIIFIGIYFFLTTLNCFTQSNIFIKKFSDSNPIYSSFCVGYPSIDTFSNHSFIGAGSYWRFPISSTDTFNYDGYLQKIEKTGVTKWIRKYRTSKRMTFINSVKTLKNKTFLICGRNSSVYNSYNLQSSGILFKVDSNGLLIWSRKYPYQNLYKNIELSNGDIAISAIDSNGYTKLVLLDPNFNLKWCIQSDSSSPKGNYLYNIIEGKNKNLLFFGYGDGNPLKAICILVDSLGNKINDFTMSTSNVISSGFYNGIKFSDNSFYLTGVSCHSSNLLAGNITKLDKNINVIWSNNYKAGIGNAEFFDIFNFAPNKLAILSEPEAYGNFPNIQRSGFTFIDSNGIVRKSILFTTDTMSVLPLKILNSNNGKLLYTGMTTSSIHYYGQIDTATALCKLDTVNFSSTNVITNFTFNKFNFTSSNFTFQTLQLYVYDAFDVKSDYYCSLGSTSSLEPIPTNISKLENSNEVSVFPNPCSNQFIITSKSNSIENNLFNSEIEIYNNKGILIYTTNTFYNNSILFNTSNFSNGIYLLKIKLFSGKIILKKIVIIN